MGTSTIATCCISLTFHIRRSSPYQWQRHFHKLLWVCFDYKWTRNTEKQTSEIPSIYTVTSRFQSANLFLVMVCIKDHWLNTWHTLYSNIVTSRYCRMPTSFFVMICIKDNIKGKLIFSPCIHDILSNLSILVHLIREIQRIWAQALQNWKGNCIAGCARYIPSQVGVWKELLAFLCCRRMKYVASL